MEPVRVQAHACAGAMRKEKAICLGEWTRSNTSQLPYLSYLSDSQRIRISVSPVLFATGQGVGRNATSYKGPLTQGRQGNRI